MSAYKIISIVLVALLAFFAFIVFLRLGSGEKIVVEGIVVEAESKPVQGLLGMREKKTFLVSPAFYEKHSINPYMANAMNLFIVVLNSNDKNAVQLVRVFSADKNLQYCATNFGNEMTEERLSGQECGQFISSSVDSVRVLIEFPDSSVQKPAINVKENTITIFTGNFNELGRTAFVALKIMFENAEETLRKTNALVEQLG